ncbi:hypothetical protein D5086_024879 [Populus alba]|uniref:Uncharacterized protein n=1 Tax=Populus alba TaxID=43335 RepID=A0ACC4B7L3_POPAL
MIKAFSSVARPSSPFRSTRPLLFYGFNLFNKSFSQWQGSKLSTETCSFVQINGDFELRDARPMSNGGAPEPFTAGDLKLMHESWLP